MITHRFGGWRRNTLLSALVLSIFLFQSADLSAADDYYEVTLDKITLLKGEVPIPKSPVIYSGWWRWKDLFPYAVLDGEGEIYVGELVGGYRYGSSRNNNATAVEEQNVIAIRVPRGQKVRGTLYLLDENRKKHVAIRFEVDRDLTSKSVRNSFLLAKERYYDLLLKRRVPGGAWFRYQKLKAISDRTGKPIEEALTQAIPNRDPNRDDTQMEETFKVFSGGRAISENLQLDRLIRNSKIAEANVPISSLRGITVAEIDWTPFLKGKKPELDSLAKRIPGDQHALFVPTFSAFITLTDEAKEYGTPILHLTQNRAEDALTQSRYETQLCLGLDEISRALGPQLIRSVAMTGSDPFLRTGTDVAILFEAVNSKLLQSFIIGKQTAAQQQFGNAQIVQGKIGTVSYHGVISPQRKISSYTATVDGTVIVSNSLAQLTRLVELDSDSHDCMANLPEYHFFRSRYSLEDKNQTGFLMVTDAAIRRWCGPKWRIAASRRTRAAAVMAQHQAKHLSELVKGKARDRLLETKLYVPDLGTLKLHESGVTSSTYNSNDFLTPISELDLTYVTAGEANSYNRWRRSYQNYWRQFFDPIGIGFSIKKQQLTADMTVMPLIAQTEYNDLLRWTGNAKIKPDTGDRHAEMIAQFIMALDHKSREMAMASNFLENAIPTIKADPFSWMGESVSIFVDQDPLWQELAKLKPEEYDKFAREKRFSFPVGLRVEVKNSLKLTLFLTGLRTLINQVAPDLTAWTTHKHAGKSYVKITPTESGQRQIGEDINIFYAATHTQLVFSLNEGVVKRVLERETEGTKENKKKEDVKKTPKLTASQKRMTERPWLGDSVAIRLNDMGLKVFSSAWGDTYHKEMQKRSWKNLHILNEWKKLFPNEDPVSIHERFWQTRLRCPGGGKYVWNKKSQTMESTVFGHPGSPKQGPKVPEMMKMIQQIDFGLTFENQGLRSKMIIDRNPN